MIGHALERSTQSRRTLMRRRSARMIPASKRGGRFHKIPLTIKSSKMRKKRLRRARKTAKKRGSLLSSKM